LPQTGLAKLRAHLKDKLVDAQIRPKTKTKTSNRYNSLPVSPAMSFRSKMTPVACLIPNKNSGSRHERNEFLRHIKSDPESRPKNQMPNIKINSKNVRKHLRIKSNDEQSNFKILF
jgi:hypothetical protein